MTKPGRKSAAELATMTPTADRKARPDADYSLADEQAEVWKGVVEALPADWIGAEAHPILAAYCRTTVQLRRLGQLITALETSDGTGADLITADYIALIKAHGATAQTLKTLATSLRLTPQSRYRAETAARNADTKRPGPRPWDL